MFNALAECSEFVNIRVKCHSDTRWSSKAAAVNAISCQLIAELQHLHDTPTKMINRHEDAALILNATEKIKYAALLYFW
jgi:hypothetical protein